MYPRSRRVLIILNISTMYSIQDTDIVYNILLLYIAGIGCLEFVKSMFKLCIILILCHELLQTILIALATVKLVINTYHCHSL